MSVEYENAGEDILFFVCDDCGDESETGEGFHDLWESLRGDGWRAHYDGEWRHSCPECVAAWAREQR